MRKLAAASKVAKVKNTNSIKARQNAPKKEKVDCSMNPVLTEEAAQTLGELMSKFRGIAHFSSSSGK